MFKSNLPASAVHAVEAVCLAAATSCSAAFLMAVAWSALRLG